MLVIHVLDDSLESGESEAAANGKRSLKMMHEKGTLDLKLKLTLHLIKSHEMLLEKLINNKKSVGLVLISQK